MTPLQAVFRSEASAAAVEAYDAIEAAMSACARELGLEDCVTRRVRSRLTVARDAVFEVRATLDEAGR